MEKLPSPCPLCTIPQHETLIYENNSFFLVQTKTLKGHKVRVMVVSKQHKKTLTLLEQVEATKILTDYMTKLMLNQEWFIVGDEHATFPDHFHLIACDFPLEEEEDPLFPKTKKILFTPTQKSTQKILIGIPAYNEEKTIAQIVEKSKPYGDVLVINDGSTDHTAEILVKNNIRFISYNGNQGYGNSIKNLFEVAKRENYTVLITLDADGQHNPSEIPNFLKAIENSDIVIGNRFTGKTNIPKYRKFGVKTINSLSGLSDSQCGFRAYNRKSIEKLEFFDKGMGASLEILKQAQTLNLKITEIPCTITYNKEKHSQNPLTHGISVLLTYFWWKIWKTPSKTLLPTGLLFLLGTVISLIQSLTFYTLTKTLSPSWTLLTFGLFISTLLIFNTLIFIVSFKNRKEYEK